MMTDVQIMSSSRRRLVPAAVFSRQLCLFYRNSVNRNEIFIDKTRVYLCMLSALYIIIIIRDT